MDTHVQSILKDIKISKPPRWDLLALYDNLKIQSLSDCPSF